MSEGIDAYIKKKFEVPDVDIRTYSPLTLAYIGDGVFDLVIRSVVDRKIVLIQLIAVYEKAGLDTSYEKCKNLYQLVESKPNAVTFCKRE